MPILSESTKLSSTKLWRISLTDIEAVWLILYLSFKNHLFINIYLFLSLLRQSSPILSVGSTVSTQYIDSIICLVDAAVAVLPIQL